MTFSQCGCLFAQFSATFGRHFASCVIRLLMRSMEMGKVESKVRRALRAPKASRSPPATASLPMRSSSLLSFRKLMCLALWTMAVTLYWYRPSATQCPWRLTCEGCPLCFQRNGMPLCSHIRSCQPRAASPWCQRQRFPASLGLLASLLNPRRFSSLSRRGLWDLALIHMRKLSAPCCFMKGADKREIRVSRWCVQLGFAAPVKRVAQGPKVTIAQTMLRMVCKQPEEFGWPSQAKASHATSVLEMQQIPLLSISEVQIRADISSTFLAHEHFGQQILRASGAHGTFFKVHASQADFSLQEPVLVWLPESTSLERARSMLDGMENLGIVCKRRRPPHRFAAHHRALADLLQKACFGRHFRSRSLESLRCAHYGGHAGGISVPCGPEMAGSCHRAL